MQGDPRRQRLNVAGGMGWTPKNGGRIVLHARRANYQVCLALDAGMEGRDGPRGLQTLLSLQGFLNWPVDSVCSPLAPSGVLVPPRHVCSDWPPLHTAKFKASFQIKCSPGWLPEESHVEP